MNSFFRDVVAAVFERGLFFGVVLGLGLWPGRAALLVDFGPAGSPLRPGFVRVTEKTVSPSAQVAGWLAGASLEAGAAPIQRSRIAGGREITPPIYLNAASCDFVGGRSAARFRLPASAGKYRLWLLVGPAGGSRSQVWDLSVRSAAGVLARATFAGPYDCRVVTASVPVTNGPMVLTFRSRSRWRVNALAWAPESEWAAVREKTLAPLEREIFLLPPDLMKKWRIRPRAPADPTPKWSRADRKRGFVLYHRPWDDLVWPTSRPLDGERPAVLKAFAAWDQYEPMTFTVLPLRDGRLDSVEVGDLTAPGGARLPAADCTVRWVRTMMARPNYTVTGICYRVPDVLMPWRGPRPLVAGENLRVWLTWYVAPGTPGGLYRGRVRLRFAGGGRAEIPVWFRVLPLALEKDRSLVYGQYYHHPYDAMFAAPDAFSRAWWRHKAECEFRDMAAHGNNTVVLGLWGRRLGGGHWVFDYDQLAEKIALYRRVGFYQPIVCHFPVGALYRHYMHGSMGSHLRQVRMPPPAFFRELTAMVRAIEAERRRRQWPELLYYPVDEPSTTDISVQFMTAVMKAIKAVPGVRTYVTADPARTAFQPMRPYVDVWCCQPFSLPRKTVMADMRKRGVAYWCYPNHVAGENDHTPVAGARMTYGFGFWRSGFRALTPWIYQAEIGNPWNYLDGSAMDFFNRTDDDGSPIPVALWEAYRAGIDDGRYITTFDRWLERAREAGKTELVRSLEKDRELVWNSIPVMPKYKYDAGWGPEAFDRFRWLLARDILTVRAALGVLP